MMNYVKSYYADNSNNPISLFSYILYLIRYTEVFRLCSHQIRQTVNKLVSLVMDGGEFLLLKEAKTLLKTYCIDNRSSSK